RARPRGSSSRGLGRSRRARSRCSAVAHDRVSRSFGSVQLVSSGRPPSLSLGVCVSGVYRCVLTNTLRMIHFLRRATLYCGGPAGLASSSQQGAQPLSTPIIFDCDTGVDDALAILYGARNGADFVACSVTHGNVPVQIGTRNTLTVLDSVGLDRVPVFAGAARPLAQPLRTAEHVHGEDGLGNTNPAPSPRSQDPSPAAVELVRLAAERPGELTLVPVGPLTNIALALMLDENFARNIKRVVLMGGAIGVAGNVGAAAEANTFCDPEAAQLVLDAPWEVTWVGLEATMRTGLTSGMIERLAGAQTPEG